MQNSWSHGKDVAMRKIIHLAMTLFMLVCRSQAQSKAVPTLQILASDVVQSSIEQFRTGTNRFAVKWAYTEAGANKMLAFYESHQGQKVRMRVGGYQTPPT